MGFVRDIAVALLIGGVFSCSTATRSTPGRPSFPDRTRVTVQDYSAGLSRVHAGQSVKLSLQADSQQSPALALIVDYPAPSEDPAARDVWCDSEHHDWSSGHAISFRIKPDHALRLSGSFFDRHRVVYTASCFGRSSRVARALAIIRKVHSLPTRRLIDPEPFTQIRPTRLSLVGKRSSYLIRAKRLRLTLTLANATYKASPRARTSSSRSFSATPLADSNRSLSWSTGSTVASSPGASPPTSLR
jgi:hypothetical protein